MLKNAKKSKQYSIIVLYDHSFTFRLAFVQTTKTDKQQQQQNKTSDSASTFSLESAFSTGFKFCSS